MATKTSKGQKATVERVMHEYKKGELTTGSTGPKVKSRKQAIAIALSESGGSNRTSPEKNKEHLSKTKSKESKGKTAEAEKEGKRAQDLTLAKGKNGGKAKSASGKSSARDKSSASKSSSGNSGKADSTSKDALYAEAKKRDIPGRSKMSKSQLQRALH